MSATWNVHYLAAAALHRSIQSILLPSNLSPPGEGKYLGKVDLGILYNVMRGNELMLSLELGSESRTKTQPTFIYKTFVLSCGMLTYKITPLYLLIYTVFFSLSSEQQLFSNYAMAVH